MTNIEHVLLLGDVRSMHVTVVSLSDRSRTKLRVEFADTVSRVYMLVNPFIVIFAPVP